MKGRICLGAVLATASRNIEQVHDGVQLDKCPLVQPDCQLLQFSVLNAQQKGRKGTFGLVTRSRVVCLNVLIASSHLFAVGEDETREALNFPFTRRRLPEREAPFNDSITRVSANYNGASAHSGE